MGFSFKSRQRNMPAAYLQRGESPSDLNPPIVTVRLSTRSGFGRLARDGRPLQLHAVGLWIGVDRMLAPLRETVKI